MQHNMIFLFVFWMSKIPFFYKLYTIFYPKIFKLNKFWNLIQNSVIIFISSAMPNTKHIKLTRIHKIRYCLFFMGLKD